MEHTSHDTTFTGQFARLRRLRDGWLDGDGLAPTPEALTVLERGFADSYPDDLPMPRLYPTAEGGVRAEWHFGSRDLSVETPFGGTNAYLHLLDLDTDEEREEHIDLSQPAGWRTLADLIRS